MDKSYGNRLVFGYISRYINQGMVTRRRNSTLKIGYLSTYGTEQCGIATYTKDIIDNIEIIDDSIEHMPIPEGDLWSRRDSDFEKVIEVLKEYQLDVLNIQHEWGLFKSELHSLSTVAISIPQPIVTTFHGILINFLPNLIPVVTDYSTYCSKIIVHNENAKRFLLNHGCEKDKIVIIPHGCPKVRKFSNPKKYVNYPRDAFVFTTAGYLTPNKGTDSLIRIFAKLLKRIPDENIFLSVLGGGAIQAGNTTRHFLYDCMKEAVKLGIQKHVGIADRVMGFNELDLHLSASDCFCLTYMPHAGGSSGMACRMMSHGKPMLMTSSYQLDEAQGDKRSYGNDEDFLTGMLNMIYDADLRKKTSKEALKYSKQHSWKKSASQYLDIFKEVSFNE